MTNTTLYCTGSYRQNVEGVDGPKYLPYPFQSFTYQWDSYKYALCCNNNYDIYSRLYNYLPPSH